MLTAWLTVGAVTANHSDGSSVSLTDTEFVDGDINHDGKVDVSDLNGLINIILGAGTPVQDPELSFTVGGETFKMMRVGRGTFTMGATPEQEEPFDQETPAHCVTLTCDYYIGETEVTQELWQAVMGNNPSLFEGDNLPVDCVSWIDCQEFISKLNQMTGKTFRLPTEAEWEFAARGGNKSNGTQYSGSTNLEEVAWYDGNSDNKTHPVATKKPNELGLYDMSGNVLEWCQDWNGDYSYRTQIDPTGPPTGSGRVSRGGSWEVSATYCRVAYRENWFPGTRYYTLGFRLVLSE